MSSVLVIGYGSIGQRHAKLLRESGLDVSIVSSRPNSAIRTFSNIDLAVSEKDFSLAIIASPTAHHFEDLQNLANAGYKSRVIIEKPIFHKPILSQTYPFGRITVGYNLRFHPLLQNLCANLVGQKIVSMYAYAGSYLPSWRPNKDYRDSYSAVKADGGGVMRDLSHEIDYLLWLGGYGASNISGLFGQFSGLQIESEDIACFTFSTKLCPACVCYLSYADKTPRRKLIVNTTTDSFELDFLANTLSGIMGETSVDVDRNYTYSKMHSEVLSDEIKYSCTIEQGIEVVNFINQLDGAN